MADIKFSGVKYDYNNVTIGISGDEIGISRIGTSGITIGGAADFDRIKGLCPTSGKVIDYSLEEGGVPVSDVVSLHYDKAPGSGTAEVVGVLGDFTYTITKAINGIKVTRITD